MRDDELRQAARDREYLAACEAAGIEPDLPAYRAIAVAEPADRNRREPELAHEDLAQIEADAAGARRNGRSYSAKRAAAPDLERTPLHDAAENLLDALLPKGCTRAACATGGIRLLALAWLLGRSEAARRPLAELAAGLGLTRATMSWHVRRVEDACGLHGRGQKTVSARDNMREARRRYVARIRREGNAEQIFRQNRKPRSVKAAEAAAKAKAAASGPAGKKLAV